MATRRPSTESIDYTCSICIEDTQDDKPSMVITRCNHIYHETCLTGWLDVPVTDENSEDNVKGCPVCRGDPVPLRRHIEVEDKPEDDVNPFMESALVRAVRDNNIDKMIKLLKLAPVMKEDSLQDSSSLELPDEARQTERRTILNNWYQDFYLKRLVNLLGIAARHGHKEIVLRLLDAGADINLLDEKGSSALIHAATEGHANLVSTLINFGADVHVCNVFGNTAAFLAASLNTEKALEYLIDAGINLHDTDGDDFTLMHRAAGSGNAEIISLLHANGLDINAQSAKAFLYTPLHVAALHDNLENTEKLLQLNANPNLTATEDELVPLHNAARKGFERICHSLLNYGAAINIRAKNGATPLMVAAQEGHIEVVRALLARGADKTLTMRRSFSYGLYPYFNAADLAKEAGHMEIYELLMQWS